MKPCVTLRRRDGRLETWTRTTIREIWRRQGGLAATDENHSAGGEKYLEDLIVARPELLGFDSDDADDPIQGPFRCFPQRTVQAMDGRSIYPDIIVLAQSGEVIVVEVKLADNQELKDRRVVGQVLEYAASLTKCGEDDLVRMFGEQHPDAREWPDLVRALFPDQPDPLLLANKLATKFRRADLHLVIACDDVPPGLAEFVKGVTDQKALGAFQFRIVEIVPYSSEALDEVVFATATRVQTEIVQRLAVEVTTEDGSPAVSVSVTSLTEAEKKARQAQERAASRSWDEATFFADAEQQLDPATLEAVRRFYDACRQNGWQVRWGKGAGTGSFHVIVPGIGDKPAITLYSAVLTINYDNLPDVASAALRDGMERMGITTPPEKKFPGLKPPVWVPHGDEIVALLAEISGKPG